MLGNPYDFMAIMGTPRRPYQGEFDLEAMQETQRVWISGWFASIKDRRDLKRAKLAQAEKNRAMLPAFAIAAE